MNKDKNGNISMLVLGVLMDGDKYGYQMIEELETKSMNVFKFKTGTLYPLLHTLEQQGYVISYDSESDSKRIRKYYQITPTGKKQLESMKENWDVYTIAVDRIVGGVRFA